jgi:hypothetical protein
MFVKGNQLGKKKTGKKFRTVKGIINNVAKDHTGKIEDLYVMMIDRVYEGLRDLPLKESSKLASELLKYVIPVKKESLNISFTFEDYLKQKQLKLQDQIMQDQSKRIEPEDQGRNLILPEPIQTEPIQKPFESEKTLTPLSMSANIPDHVNECTDMICLPDTTNKS